MGARIGEVIRVDTDLLGCGWGECLRVRVRMKLANPLKRASLVRYMGVNNTVLFQYERLPSFCFAYGKIGHGERDCAIGAHEELYHRDTLNKYGPWLRRHRASTRQQRRRGMDRKRIQRVIPQYRAQVGMKLVVTGEAYKGCGGGSRSSTQPDTNGDCASGSVE